MASVISPDVFASVEAFDLKLVRAGRAVLDGLSFSACAGEVVAIIGPNGAGKSSLLNAMAGELALTAGRITLHGLPIDTLALADRARCVAVLAQQNRLNFPFRVSEVVAMGRMPFASGYQRDNDICREAMQASDCLDFHGRLYTRLSGGEQQRVQLARVFAQAWPALALTPQYLFLDEPSAGLDLSHQQMLLRYCRLRAQQNAVIVVVLHDLNLACQYADRILLLNQGKLVANGSPWDICRAELLADVYGVDVHISAHPEKNCPVVLL